MWLTIVIVIVVILYLIAGPQAQRRAMQKDFEGSEEDFQMVQKDLKQQLVRDDKFESIYSKEELEEQDLESRLDYQMNDLRRKYVMAVMVSDSYSLGAKQAVIQAWKHLLFSQKWLILGINSVGVGSDQLREQAGTIHEARIAFSGAMRGAGFNLEKEEDELRKKLISKQK